MTTAATDVRVLFVDDEPNLLAGLRRSLRKSSKSWSMSFAQSGEEALKLMESQPQDVVVSDMRMPGMDGPTFLTEVKARCPETFRLVLSGYATRESVLDVLPVAHQFLGKPCSPAAIANVVSRAMAVRGFLSDPSLRTNAAGLDALPAAPGLLIELMRKLDQPDVSMNEVAETVIQDPAMVAKVLQLVNSAFMGLSRSVSDINEAVNFLGSNMLRTLVTTVEAFRTFEPPGGSVPGFSLPDLQKRGLLTAKVASALLPAQRDEAFLCGMLQEMGQVVVACTSPVYWNEALEAARSESQPLVTVEQARVGVTHESVGAYLLALWGLEPYVVEAAAQHHRVVAPSCEVLGPVEASRIASQLVEEVQGLGVAQLDRSPQPLEESLPGKLVTPDQLKTWRRMVKEQVERLT